MKEQNKRLEDAAQQHEQEETKQQQQNETDEIEETFSMSPEEIEETKENMPDFNPFLDLKAMEYDKPIKFKVISDSISVREFTDKFRKGQKIKKMVLAVETLESKEKYDITAPKDKNSNGKYSSITTALRYFYAATDGNIKDRIIEFTKSKYNHEIYGEKNSYSIKIVE